MTTKDTENNERARPDNTITNPANITQSLGVPTVAGGLFRPEGGARDLKDNQCYAVQNLRPWQGVLTTRPGRQAFGLQVAPDEAILYLTNVRLRDLDEPVALTISDKSVYGRYHGSDDTVGWQKIATHSTQALPHDTHVTTTTIKGATADELMIATFDQVRAACYVDNIHAATIKNLTLEGNDIKARIVRQLNDHVILFGTNENGVPCLDRVRWGDRSDPLNFDEEGTTADFVDLNSVNSIAQGYGEIVAAEPLQTPQGDVMIIYQEWGVHVMQWSGGKDIFSFRRILSTEGACSPKSVVPILTAEGRAHVVFGQRGIYIHKADSLSKDISHDSIFQYMIDHGVTGTNRYRIFGYDRPRDFCVNFHVAMDHDPSATWDTQAGNWEDYPTSAMTWDASEPNTVVSFNYAEGTWTLLTEPDSILCGITRSVRKHSFQAGVTMDEVLYGTNDGWILKDEVNTGYDRTTNITSMLETKEFVNFDPNVSWLKKGRLQFVTVEAKGSGQMTIQVAFDGGDWNNYRTVTLASAWGLYSIWPNTSCEFFQIKVQCTNYEDGGTQPSYMTIKQILRGMIPGTER